MRVQPRYLIGFLATIAGVVVLGTTVFQSSLQYYVTVDELLTAPETYSTKTLKVAGTVKDGSIQKSSGTTLDLNFVIVGGHRELPVRYQGLVPDTFKAGGDVVATGKMMPDGVFKATHLLAKCASPYEVQLK